MATTPARNRHPRAAPITDPENSSYLQAGIAAFNAGSHWHAHEEWEHLWLGLEGDDKVFAQGLIMAAAMLVQYDKGVRRGVVNHWDNVQLRLPPYAPVRWGIDVAGLLRQLAPFADDANNEIPLSRGTSTVQIGRKD